jgi:hypothetical protein
MLSKDNVINGKYGKTMRTSKGGNTVRKTGTTSYTQFVDEERSKETGGRSGVLTSRLKTFTLTYAE